MHEKKISSEKLNYAKIYKKRTDGRVFHYQLHFPSKSMEGFLFNEVHGTSPQLLKQCVFATALCCYEVTISA